MGILDFLKTEKRESQPFTEAIQAAIFEQASGSAPLDVKALGALEVAAVFWPRPSLLQRYVDEYAGKAGRNYGANIRRSSSDAW